MASIESNIIDAVRDALIAAGYTVFDSILDHHTGRRTKSKTYIEIDRFVTTDWTEVTQETITGPYTFGMRYRQNVTLVKNSNGEMVDFTTNCQLIEKTISQVQTGPMFNRPNVSQDGSQTGSNRDLNRDFVVSGILATTQDRSQPSDAKTWNQLQSDGTTWNDLNTTTWDSLEPV